MDKLYIYKKNHNSIIYTQQIQTIYDDASELVSVIIPTYNRFTYLLNTIESIKNQTYKNIEIIVVNDRSTQKEYYEYDWNGVTVIHLEKNSKDIFGFACPGGYQRNYGINIASGKYIAFCDDDDIWFPTKLEIQINAMKASSCKISSTEALYGFGVYNNSNEYKKYLQDNKLNLSSDGYLLTLDIIKKRNYMICSSVIIDKELIDKIGKFIIANTNEDYDYWLRALEYTNCVLVNKPLVYYDKGHAEKQNYSRN